MSRGTKWKLVPKIRIRLALLVLKTGRLRGQYSAGLFSRGRGETLFRGAAWASGLAKHLKALTINVQSVAGFTRSGYTCTERK